MSGAQIGQARQLTRLRQARLTGAARVLEAARAATRDADAAATEAGLAADAADAALARARTGLATDLGEAERLLAVADKSRFARAMARGIAEEAADRLAAHEAREADHRRALIRAHIRHDRLAGHLGLLVRRKRANDEEREAEI